MRGEIQAGGDNRPFRVHAGPITVLFITPMCACILVLFVLAASHSRAAEFMPDLRRAPQPTPAALAEMTAGANGKRIDTAQAWEQRRGELRAAWAELIGPFPDRVSLKSSVISTERLDDHTRLRVRYQTDATTSNEAYILVPKDARPKHPGMVVLHQTSKTNLRDPVGLAGRESVHIALHLVRRGYVCVAPRNFLWSFNDKTYQQAAEAVLAKQPWKTGMAKMTWDAIRATDLLLEQASVDPQRIGTIGHSLGGKEVLYHAAFDERIKAAVSCEGGVGLAFSNWEAAWYLGSQVKSPDFRRDHQELIALIAPRALLIIGGESADGARSWPYVESNLPVWRLLGAGDRLGLLRHAHGHNFPPPGEEREKVYKWLDRSLRE